MADSTNKKKWNDCIEYCKSKLDEQQFMTWIIPVSFCSYVAESKTLTIGVPSNYFYEVLEARYARLIIEAIQLNFGPNTRLFYKILVDKENKQTNIVEGQNTTTIVEEPSKKKAIQNKKEDEPEIDSHLITEYSFDNFIEGESNLLPRSVGMSIAENPKQKTFNPLFIFGHSGVGKTHLVNAIGTKLKENFPKKRVIYLDTHLFHLQFVEAKFNNNIPEFIKFYQQFDVLILDDVHELIGLDKTQNAFFHIFNHLKQNGKQIILTCDRAPLDLQGMEERLLTRFKWGLVAELCQPNEQLRHDILESKIQRNGLKIPKSVIDYISENVTESVRELEGVVNSLLAYSIVQNRNVDLNLAKRIISNATRIENKPITVEDIISHVCAYYKVKKDDIFTKSRKASIVEVRQVAMYLAHKLTNTTVNKIGILIGGRTHATVLHSIGMVEDQLITDEKLQNAVSKITQDVKAHKPIEK